VDGGYCMVNDDQRSQYVVTIEQSKFILLKAIKYLVTEQKTTKIQNYVQNR
jgi:hypothetical protein